MFMPGLAEQVEEQAAPLAVVAEKLVVQQHGLELVELALIGVEARDVVDERALIRPGGAALVTQLELLVEQVEPGVHDGYLRGQRWLRLINLGGVNADRALPLLVAPALVLVV